MPGFRECARQLAANTSLGASLRDKYSFPNTTETSALITTAGCLALCGDANDYYPWYISASTITTWILPVIGILLQAPFSNSFARNMLAIIRWLGSPIASLASILRDIKNSGRAAVLVDMSVRYDEFPGQEDSFADVRDGLWALVVMSDFDMVKGCEEGVEGLLRIALFADDLKLGNGETLRDARREFVQELREMRRKGIVPVFVSTLWFLFAFGLSIQTAFENLGDKSASHDLALGCLLAWFPALTLCSIIDHSPQDAKATRKKLNSFIGRVRDTLQDKTNRENFLGSFTSRPQQDLENWILNIVETTQDVQGFFLDCYGQGQIRWQLGIPSRMLLDIESSNTIQKGRNWLKNEGSPRTELVFGQRSSDPPLHSFSQVFGAISIVCGGFGGAFTLSYFTPRVYLGCRSRGYLIFFIASLSLQLIELIVVSVVAHLQDDKKSFTQGSSSGLRQNRFYLRLKGYFNNVETIVWVHIIVLRENFDQTTLPSFLQRGSKVRTKTSALYHSAKVIFKQTSFKTKLEVLFFRPIEAASFAWLLYIVLAQTFGLYNNCICATRPSGYVDIGSDSQFTGKFILDYWIAGTVISSTSMMVAILFVTVEWCQQSFLSTEDYDSAMSGLYIIRGYRKWTYPFRLAMRMVVGVIIKLRERLSRVVGISCDIHRSLLWTPYISKNTPTTSSGDDVHQETSPGNNTSYIQLSDYSSGNLSDIFDQIQVSPCK